MHLVHLTASSFFGGPERQMLGLARVLPTSYRSTFLSFAEDGQLAPIFWNRSSTPASRGNRCATICRACEPPSGN